MIKEELLLLLQANRSEAKRESRKEGTSSSSRVVSSLLLLLFSQEPQLRAPTEGAIITGPSFPIISSTQLAPRSVVIQIVTIQLRVSGYLHSPDPYKRS